MKRKSIICIDLRKYNNEQLTKVSEIVGINDGDLQENKKLRVIKVLLDDERKTHMAVVFKNPTGRHYKGLVIDSDYSAQVALSKRDFEYLLKMPATDFDLKKKKEVPEAPVEKTDEVLDIDTILDKISKSGLSSLTKREKDFLDRESKK